MKKAIILSVLTVLFAAGLTWAEQPGWEKIDSVSNLVGYCAGVDDPRQIRAAPHSNASRTISWPRTSSGRTGRT